MLQHIPAWMGRLLGDVRAGHEKLAIMKADAQAHTLMINLTSPALAAEARLPVRLTADRDGVSPRWCGEESQPA